MRVDLVPDDLWERVAPLLPPVPERRHRHPGRLRVPDRAAMAGIIYVLRTGVAWRDVPAQAVGCSGVTAWRRLRDWTEAGVWPRLHTALLTELRRADLLDLDDCAVDGSPSEKADPSKVARRARCQIPAALGHVEKWQLALDMVDETRSWGVHVPLAIADAGYGDAAAFRLGLNERGLNYIVGISTTLSAQPGSARPFTPPYSGTGRPPVARYPDPAKSVKALVTEAGRKAARPVSWREGSRPGKGRTGFKRMYSRFVALRIRPAGREIRDATVGVELPESWLLAEWPAKEPEPVQFWLSDLPTDTPLATLVRLAKLRWRIEHDYREMKQVLGLAHFEGRTFTGWHHHVTLVALAHAFCTLRRLARGPKEAAAA